MSVISELSRKKYARWAQQYRPIFPSQVSYGAFKLRSRSREIPISRPFQQASFKYGTEKCSVIVGFWILIQFSRGAKIWSVARSVQRWKYFAGTCYARIYISRCAISRDMLSHGEVEPCRRIKHGHCVCMYVCTHMHARVCVHIKGYATNRNISRCADRLLVQSVLPRGNTKTTGRLDFSIIVNNTEDGWHVLKFIVPLGKYTATTTVEFEWQSKCWMRYIEEGNAHENSMWSKCARTHDA